MIRYLLAIALLCGFFPACNTNDSGTEIPNELVGREFIAGRTASDAEVKLIPVGYVPGDRNDSGRTTVVTLRTDGEGRFSVSSVAAGEYNIVASKDALRSFRDSIAVTGKGQQLGSDTLKSPGSLTGWIGLQPQDNPRTSTVQVLGTTLFVNVEQDGEFHLPNLGAGQYQIRVVTFSPGYVPLIKEVTIDAGRADTLADTLRPFYSLTPVVQGITASALPKGIVKISWNRSDSKNVDAYLIYRDPESATLPSQLPIGKTRDTVFADSLYSLVQASAEGRYDLRDSVAYSIHYRVKILDKSGMIGPSFGGADAVTIPPSRQFTSGAWTKAVAAAAFPKRSRPGVAVFKDKLWLFGGSTAAKIYHDIWSSSDGISWTKVADSIPGLSLGSEPVVFQGMLWLYGGVRSSFDTGFAQGLKLYHSMDGLAWMPAILDSAASVDDTSRGYGGILGYDTLGVAMKLQVFQGKLASIAGHAQFDSSAFMTSGDGIEWQSAVLPANYFGTGGTGQIVFLDKFWRIGGQDPWSRKQAIDIWNTADGIEWELSAESTDFLPRYDNVLVASDSRIYSIGGSRDIELNPDHKTVNLYDEVWSSPNGVDWAPMDIHAPFGQRIGPGAAYFKGKLWLIGGQMANGAFTNDIWYLDNP
ncbi:MAG: hypothetical protein ABI036_09470 [Fibrobacteria bacterium]